MAHPTQNLICYLVNDAGRLRLGGLTGFGWLTEQSLRDPNRPFSWSLSPQEYTPTRGGLLAAVNDAKRFGGRVVPMYTRRHVDGCRAKTRATMCGVRSASAARCVRGPEKTVRQAARRAISAAHFEWLTSDNCADDFPPDSWWPSDYLTEDAVEANLFRNRHWLPEIEELLRCPGAVTNSR